MTTGEKIYSLRKKAQITQEAFAEQLEVSRQAVSKWESDQAYPETDKIIKIAQMFGVTCDYLLNDAPRYESDLVDKKNRDFLTMLVSFSIACVTVGLIVALICFYAISEWYCSLVGLGVLAGLLLAAFILWSVGRYKFLSSCNYSEDDKSHLAKWTKVFLYTAIIAVYCYLPTVVFIGLKTNLTLGSSLFDVSAEVFLKLPIGMLALSQLIFVPVGIAVARIISAVHDRLLKKVVSAVQWCDGICLTVILSACALAYVDTTYVYFEYLAYPNWDWNEFGDGVALILLIISCIFAVTLIVQSCIRLKYEGLNKKVLALHIVCIMLLVLNFALFLAAHIEYADVYFYLNIVMGVALAVIAVVLIIASVMDAKQTNLSKLNWLRTSLPCYAFALIQLYIYIDDEFSVIVWLALHCLIAAIAGLLKFRRKSENAENELK